MSLLSTMLASALLAVPAERHIDFSGWSGTVPAEFDVRVMAMDGTAYETTIQLAPRSDGDAGT